MSAMAPGYELNQLIVRHVFGWSEIIPGVWRHPEGEPDEGVEYWLLARYSSNIAAAWDVVTRLADEGHVVIVKADGLRTYPHAQRYTVMCDATIHAHADTAPLAICLAALKVRGVAL